MSKSTWTHTNSAIPGLSLYASGLYLWNGDDNSCHTYWGGQKVCLVFFCKIKDTFFIFTNNLIDFDILSMLAVSHMAECWLFSISWFDCYQLQLVNRGTSSSEKSPARNFANHFWHIPSVTALSPYTAQVFFFAFQLRFYLFWNNKASYVKNVAYFLPSSILKRLHKNSPILI